MQRPWGRNRLDELRTTERPVWLQQEMGPERQKGPITWGPAGLGKTSFNSVASMRVHRAPEASFTDGMEQIHSGVLDLSVGRSIRSDWGRRQERSGELRNHVGTEVTEAWIGRAPRLTVWGRDTHLSNFPRVLGWVFGSFSPGSGLSRETEKFSVR